MSGLHKCRGTLVTTVDNELGHCDVVTLLQTPKAKRGLHECGLSLTNVEAIYRSHMNMKRLTNANDNWACTS